MSYNDYSQARRRWSSPHEDPQRDPMTLNAALHKITTHKKWEQKLAKYDLLCAIPAILGEEISSKVHNIHINDSTVIIKAVSTAWATQLRFMEKDILTRINNEHSYKIHKIMVYGPTPPKMKFGPKHIPGRGPRDTYG